MPPSSPHDIAWRFDPTQAEPSRARKEAVATNCETRRLIRQLTCVIALIVVCLSSAAGCATRRKPVMHPNLASEVDALRHLQRAMTDESPDERRIRVDYVAQTRHVSREPVVDALSSIARLDTSDSVRCSALRALGLSGHPKAAATCCAVLGVCPVAPPDEESPLRPASTEVREQALAAAVSLFDSSRLAEEHREHLAEAAMSLLMTDRSRNIRLTSAQVLGYCPDRVVFDPLIGALRQRDFGVVYESERSLMRLTGKTFDHDPNRWEAWLSETSDPFTDAGKLDHVVNQPEKPWGVRKWNKFKRTINSFKPQTSGT